MANEYTWSIAQLYCYPEKDGLQQVVGSVDWILCGTDGTNFSYKYGNTQIGLNTSNPYIDFNNLEEVTVVSWVENSIDADFLAALKGVIDSELAAKSSAPEACQVLPWS